MTALKPLAEGVWGAERWVTLTGGFKLQVRMTVMRLLEGGLMVVSPITPSPEMLEDIKSKGRVRFIVAPNCLHHLYINDFSHAFPSAERWGPKDLTFKRTDIIFKDTLSDKRPMPWSESVECISVKARAPVFEEFLFFHKESQSLLVTDLMFNLQSFHSWREKMFAKINGVHLKLATSRISQKFFNDEDSLRGALEKIESWRPAHLIVAHGDVIHDDATAKVVSALKKIL